jgi:hypothetical protein
LTFLYALNPLTGLSKNCVQVIPATEDFSFLTVKERVEPVRLKTIGDK